MDVQLILLAICVVVVIILLLTCLLGRKEEEFIPPLLLKENTQTTKKTKAQPKKHKEKQKHKEDGPVIDRKAKVEELIENAVDDSHNMKQEIVIETAHISTQKSGRGAKKSPKIVEEMQEIKEESIPRKRNNAKQIEKEVELEDQEEVETGEHPQDPSNHEQNKKNKKKNKKAVEHTIIAQQNKPIVTANSSSKHLPPQKSEELDLDYVIEQLRKSTLDANSLSIVVECMLLRQQYEQKMKQRDMDVKQLHTVNTESDAEIKRLRLASTQAEHKCRDLKRQLDVEATKTTSLESTYRDSLGSFRNESNNKIQAAEQRIKHLTEQNAALNAKLQNVDKNVDTNRFTQEIQRLQGEMGNQLQKSTQREAQLATELAAIRKNSVNLANMEHKLCEAEKARKVAEEKCRNIPKVDSSIYDKKIRELEQENCTKNTKIYKIEEEWNKVMIDVGKITKENSGLKSDLNAKDRQLKEMSNKMNIEPVQTLKMTQSSMSSPKQNGHANNEEELSTLRTQVKEYVNSMTKLEVSIKENVKKEKTLQDNFKIVNDKLTKAEEEKNSALTKLADAKKVADKAPTADSLNKLRKELEQSLNARNSLESQVTDLKKEVELNESKNSDNDVITKQVNILNDKCEAADKKLGDLTRQLEEERNGRNSAEAKVKELNKQINNIQNREKGNTNEIDCLKSLVNEKESEKNNLVEKLQNEAKALQKQVEELQSSKVGQVNAGIASAQWKEVESKNDVIQSLNKQLEEQRNKNHELREKSYRAVDSVEQIERTTKDMVKKIQEDKANEMKTLRISIETLLLKLCPKMNVKDLNKKSAVDWICSVENLLEVEKSETHTHTQTTIHEINPQDSTLVRENKELKNKLANYQTVLTQVDEQLREHEKQANLGAHAKMNDRCTELERELARTKTEQSHANEESLKSTEEVKSQLSKLQNKLEIEERERLILRESIVRLEKDLDSERSTGRDLSAQAVKLRGMLKTGQDALKQEQIIVTELKAQISDLNGSETQINGQSSKSVGDVELNNQLDKLRKRLETSEKQLESEKSHTDQLTKKLTSLGV